MPPRPKEQKMLVNYLTQRRRLRKSKKISWGVFFLPVIQLVCGKRRSVSPECEWALGWEKCYSSVFMWRHHWELPFTLSQSAINCEPKIPSYCFTWGRSICRDVCHTKSIWISHWTRNHTWVTNFLFLILFDVSIQVSWIRKRDLHILTSENFVFSSDQRFTVLHQPDSEEWNLKIEYVTLKDDGTYECQINTEPKIKLSVLLEVTGEREKRKRKVCRKKIYFKLKMFLLLWSISNWILWLLPVPEVLQERIFASANSFNGKGNTNILSHQTC